MRNSLRLTVRRGVVAAGLLVLLAGWFSPPAHAAVHDLGGQYGWTNPISTPTDQPAYIRTQGRCNGGGGQMMFMDGGGNVLYGAINVPHEWHFSDGYGFHIPAGLPVGDYSVFVDCGGGNQIWISQWITAAGTGVIPLDYVDGVVSGVLTPPPTAAPQANPSSDGSGITVTDGGTVKPSRTTSAPRAHTSSAPTTAAPVVATPDTTTPPAVVATTVVTEMPSTTTTSAPDKLAVVTISDESGGVPRPMVIGAGGAFVAGIGFVFLRRRRSALHV